MVVWLIGLSGSGKSTLGFELAKLMRREKPNTVLIDGDEIRNIFKHNTGNDPYTIDGRRLNAERIASMCEWLDKQNINVVCCILSIFEDILDNNRGRYSSYHEIFMDAPLSILKQRDVKGIYGAFERGEINNVIGCDIPFPRPNKPDIIIDSSSNNANIPQLAESVLKQMVLN